MFCWVYTTFRVQMVIIKIDSVPRNTYKISRCGLHVDNFDSTAIKLSGLTKIFIQISGIFIFYLRKKWRNTSKTSKSDLFLRCFSLLDFIQSLFRYIFASIHITSFEYNNFFRRFHLSQKLNKNRKRRTSTPHATSESEFSPKYHMQTFALLKSKK